MKNGSIPPAHLRIGGLKALRGNQASTWRIHMYHLSNLGRFAEQVRGFSDLNGYVPEVGDTPQQFVWDNGEPPYDWDQYVASAVEATNEAEKQVQAWRDQ